ncbi:hypothetical protein LXL04_006538 [Taraxacum kok-saghyz]
MTDPFGCWSSHVRHVESSFQKWPICLATLLLANSGPIGRHRETKTSSSILTDPTPSSSSSSSIMASPGAYASCYDVFLSFRGEDTRYSFTDHLYERLTGAGISTFWDNEFNRGEEVGSEIERAVKESRASIVVLSDNYATSTWCLDELLLIVEQRRKCNHFVLPVFYHVDPSDVRKQNGTFAIKVKASSRWTDQNVNLWMKALKEVADLSGEVLCWYAFLNLLSFQFWYSYLNGHHLNLLIFMCSSRPETEVLKEIVNILHHKLCSKEVHLPPNLTGMATRYKDINSLINEPGVNFLAICGMGGSGKTTLAQYIYDSNWRFFENTSFVEDIGDRCKGHNGLLQLQEQLLNDISFGKNRKIPGVSQGTCKMEEALQKKRALIVLDDIVEEDQLVALLGTAKINPENIHVKIKRVLIFLTHESNKELFLHIACFFVGKDKDYVEKILEHDCSAISGIQILCNRCLLSVSPKNKLVMHRLLQEIGKSIVRQEALKFPEKRSRVWLSSDSYKILSKGEGSETVEGLALDMEMLRKEKFSLKSSNLKTDALQNMDKLKLLHLNRVSFDGSYENFSEDLIWLCWTGFHLKSIPSELSMRKLVAIDMSYSRLEVFEPPMDLQSLQILNLKDSHYLTEIRNISRIPNLETLILWNCYSLVRVCDTIRDLTCLTLLNMTGCENLCNKVQRNLLVGIEASPSRGGVVAGPPTFSFPHSLHRLSLKDCNFQSTDSFPLSFSAQVSLEYLNLGNNLFEFLPYYDHLKKLRVLDLSLCTRLKWLLCLPSTLAELYVYYCVSLEKITFQSARFTLQEFGYEGCISLSEVEGFITLVHVAKLDENDLGHMKWLKEYQYREVCLVGDDELTKGRSSCVQMLYEFGIRSTSVPDITDPEMKPSYVTELSCLSFEVPPCPKNRRLKGLDVTFKYTISSDDDWTWFCKISTNNGVDLMYNPKVFGKPDSGKAGMWLSYWPIGNTLNTGDKVSVSIVVMSGLEVHECGVSLVYSNDKAAEETSDYYMDWVEILGGDLSAFELSTGAYYLCRRDFFELMEVGRLTPDWFTNLAGDPTIDVVEVRGWRKTGRPRHSKSSFTELKAVRCIIHGPETEEIYNITEMTKLSFIDNSLEVTPSIPRESVEYGTSSTFRHRPLQGKDEKLGSNANLEIYSRDLYKDANVDKKKKVVLKVDVRNDAHKLRIMKKVSTLSGVESISVGRKRDMLTVIGDFDLPKIVAALRKLGYTEVVSVGPADEEKKDVKKEDKKDDKEDNK